MATSERAAIMRAQKHGWVVEYVAEDCVILGRAWVKRGRRHVLFVFPDGHLTAKTLAA